MQKRKRSRREDSLLTARALTKRYGEAIALGPVDLDVRAGELVTIVGHNGSGKSTLLRLAAGLLDPTEGTIAIEGHPAGSFEARSRISYVPDTPVLYDDLSVWEHLEYLGPLHGVDDWEARGQVLLQRFGLIKRADDLPVTFSRGLRQKAALTLGFTRDYTLLAVDEPFVGLDLTGRTALLDLLDQLRSSGRAAVVATHDPDFADRVDRCIALREGQIVHDGPTSASSLPALIG